MLFQTPNFGPDAAGDKADGYPQAAGSKLSESAKRNEGHVQWEQRNLTIQT